MIQEGHPATGRIALGSIAGGLCTGGLEAAGRGLSHGLERQGLADVAAALAVSSLLGALLGLASALLARVARVDGPARRITTDALARVAGSGVLPVALGLAAAAAVLGAAVPLRALALRSPGLSGLVSVGAAALAFAAFLGAGSLAAGRRGPALTARAAGLALLAATAVASCALAPMRPALEPSGLWDLCLVGVWAAGGLGAALSLPPSRAVRNAALAAAAASVLSGAGALAGLHASPSLRDRVGGERRPISWATAALRTAVDLDGDGFSPLFGGGDCDDFDIDVNPEGIEVAGNGVDENCAGGDRAAAYPWRRRPSFVPLPAGTGPASSLLLISVDSLRPDHMSVYGYPRKTTPRIDGLAERAAVFTRAYSSAPTTRIAIPVLFTGRSLGGIAWDRRVFPYAMLDRNTTLAGILKAQGFDTAAFVTHEYLGRRWNFTQGFDTVDESLAFEDSVYLSKSTGADLSRKAAAWISAHRDRRFFAWLHFMDPHSAYLKHPEGTDFGPEKVDRYDGEIEYTDKAVGALLDALDGLGLSSRTVVALLGDHGEFFGEHGRTTHGGCMWEVGSRIPLLVAAPGFAPSRPGCVTGHVDLACTLLNLLGLDCAAHGIADSATLVPEMLGAACDPEREVVLEMKYGARLAANLKALVGERWKFVTDESSGAVELYDLAEDPGETRNVAARHPSRRDAMRDRLRAWSELFDNREAAVILDASFSDALPGGAEELDVRFENGMRIVGVDFKGGRVNRDEPLTASLYLRAERRIREDCVFRHDLVHPNGKRYAKDSHVPLNGTFPLRRWPPRRIAADQLFVELRKDVRPGPLRVLLGLECGGEPQRVTVGGIGERALIGEIRVTGKGER